MGRLLVLLLVLAPLGARAQIIPEREIEIVKATYDAGNYAEALRRARDAMAVSNFTDVQRVELHKYAGLSAFNLGDTAGAQKHFLQLLQLNPDYVLDPFAVPPPAIKLFEQVKSDNADALNLVRQQIALRIEQEKRAAAEKARAQADEEARRKRLDELSRRVTVRTVEQRSLLVNFVPFGAGQFQQGRNTLGAIFAASEGVFALTSIIAYFAIESLFEPVTLNVPDLVVPYSVTLRRIPEARQGEANVWRALKVGTGVAFYAAWALGVGEALWHYQGEVVTEHQELLPAPPPAPAPGPKLNLFLGPGGAGAGLTVHF